MAKDTAKLIENNIIDPIETKVLVERILSATQRKVFQIDENRSSPEFRKASDQVVSAFDRWLKYAKTGDWDLKDAQHVLENLDYVTRGIKKLV